MTSDVDASLARCRMSFAQLLPWTTTPPASPDPSRPMLWRRISAPVSWVTDSRSASAAAALLEVDPIELDPVAARLHQRSGLAGQPGDVGRAELDVVEEHRPRDVAQLVGADDRTGRRLGEQPQRRRRLAARQRGSPHVETDRRERRAAVGHEPPRLVLAERDLSRGAAARRDRAPGRRGRAAPIRRRRHERRRSVRNAASIGDELALAGVGAKPTPATRPAVRAASSCTISLGRASDR